MERWFGEKKKAKSGRVGAKKCSFANEENSEKFKGTLKILNNMSTTQSSILKSAVGQGTTLSTKTFKNQLVQIQAIR